MFQNEDDLNQIYNWIDEIPLTRPKKNIARDFSDGVLLAEVVAHFLPKLVEIHNYSPAHSATQKMYNWNTLNQKVFKKIGFQLSKTDVDNVINCQPEAVERVLRLVQLKVEKFFDKPRQEQDSTSPLKPGKNGGQQQYSDGGGRSSQEQGNYTNSSQMAYNNSSGNDSNDRQNQKEGTIQELKETVEILELKIKKLEQLIKLKDSKIQTLQNKLAQNGIN